MSLRSGGASRLLVETIVVLIGVLAALAVDAWTETRSLRTEAEAAQAQLDREIERNLQELRLMERVVAERMALLEEIDPREGMALAGMVDRFVGYRSPDLSEAAWTRLSTGPLVAYVDADRLDAAFELYVWNGSFGKLEEEVFRLVHSRAFFDPDELWLALDISKGIMRQQMSWAGQAIPEFERYVGT